MGESRVVNVALVGQPNVGKSTVFNLLTGLSQHVGNWPGKTVEHKSGTCSHNEFTFELVDLPGTYSLSANSPEELLTREYIIEEKPDVVVAIVNAAAIERSLYLVAELLALESPLVVGLNMIDVAAQQGLHIESHVLEAALGVPVVPMTATRGEGVRELLLRIEDLVCGRTEYRPNSPDIRPDHKDVLDDLLARIDGQAPESYPPKWVALKILEGDPSVTEMMRGRLSETTWKGIEDIMSAHEDACVAVASGRYEWIARMTRAAVVRPRAGQITLTDRLDRWATHPMWGLLVLGAVLGPAFWLTYTVGSPLTQWLDGAVVGRLASAVEQGLSFAPALLRGLLVDGVIGSVGSVLSFLPILAIFFAFLAFLEDVGYMARAAYVMDRFMHGMGLHGKSFVPLFLGFGCNVPAVLGARVIDSPRARLLTILLAPLVPCTGRLAAVAFLAPAFFRDPATVTWALLVLNLAVLGISGLIANRLLLSGEPAPFIMELPLYHLPNWRTILLTVWTHLRAFVEKAATIILAASVIVWLLATLPTGDIQSSWIAWIGRGLDPLGQAMGLDWRMMVALLAGLVAKENTVASLGVLFGVGQESGSLLPLLRSALTPAAGLAFLVMEMLFIPCVGTVGAIKQETRSWRWTVFSVCALLVLSLVGGLTAYRVALLLGWN